MKEEYDRLKDELGDDLVSKAALEAFKTGMSASDFVEKLREIRSMREEPDRLNDEFRRPWRRPGREIRTGDI